MRMTQNNCIYGAAVDVDPVQLKDSGYILLRMIYPSATVQQTYHTRWQVPPVISDSQVKENISTGNMFDKE
ncbi:hypothetical protein N7510_011784 [Penicillium lagena]|uniref:uncharacterized protein n=1 Tax=Penicillium lagena TaxID=94218 RepID=UPI002540AD91|nr:uncharacterized protein N7510_011784 [Penicillium lagena]KAJ5602250.1 hypothetical protein N7510_011784 [Penicillium lagena]